MILKSLSRKTRSFAQLIAYMDDQKADTRRQLHQHCFSRGQSALAGEFYENSKLLKSRKDGNYLYHEILSIDLKDGIDREYAKECLREIALEYVQKRCPRNMVYGTLHEDHRDHIHYHLLISANERESRTRFRISKKAFDTIKQELETYVLTQYPELKQDTIITASKKEKKLSRKASDQKRRTGTLERKDQVRNTLLDTITQAKNLEDFISILSAKNYVYYTRGKNYGVEVTHTDGRVIKYRFSGLGVHDVFEEFLSVNQKLEEAQATEDIPQETPSPENSQNLEVPKEASDSSNKTQETKSAFLQEMENKRQKKNSKKARKGKPKSK